MFCPLSCRACIILAHCNKRYCVVTFCVSIQSLLFRLKELAYFFNFFNRLFGWLYYLQIFYAMCRYLLRLLLWPIIPTNIIIAIIRIANFFFIKFSSLSYLILIQSYSTNFTYCLWHYDCLVQYNHFLSPYRLCLNSNFTTAYLSQVPVCYVTLLQPLSSHSLTSMSRWK